VIESPQGEILGYCRLEGFERSIQAASEHNFTFVDLDGNDVARAERPFHWENGAKEHVWNVSIMQPGPPGSIGDSRAIITTVVHLMLLDEQTDFCQDIVFTITPVIITMTYCAPPCRNRYPCASAPAFHTAHSYSNHYLLLPWPQSSRPLRIARLAIDDSI
jgi:hypothetical protein